MEAEPPSRSSAPYAIYNIVHDSPINLMKFIEAIEAKESFLEMQVGDAYKTYADTQGLTTTIGHKAKVVIKVGMGELNGTRCFCS